RIVVIDDDPLVRNALRRLLRSVGFEVVTYESAEQFAEEADAVPGDCLVLDVHLPGRSGLDLQHEIVEADDRAPIIFVTATQRVANQRIIVDHYDPRDLIHTKLSPDAP
ncbi:MAG: response regulator, partial [Planctomycetota bacterium]